MACVRRDGVIYKETLPCVTSETMMIYKETLPCVIERRDRV